MAGELDPDELVRGISRLFALVIEALSAATHALLAGESGVGQQVVDADRVIDELTRELDQKVWAHIDAAHGGNELRPLIALLLMLSEMERSADLAEHIAQRSLTNLGSTMTPLSRGIVQRMSEVALDMWSAVATSYLASGTAPPALDAHDDEMDLLFLRLTEEVEQGAMSIPSAAQVTLLARFYERLGDHAVNLARRIESLPPRRS